MAAGMQGCGDVFVAQRCAFRVKTLPAPAGRAGADPRGAVLPSRRVGTDLVRHLAQPLRRGRFPDGALVPRTYSVLGRPTR